MTENKKTSLRDYANKFNMVLLQRAKNRIDDKKTTGITRLLERNSNKESHNNFDKLYKDHIIEGHKNRNIRGLFRVPDNGQHLVVDAEKEDDEDENKEQQMQVPININENAQVEHKKVIMSYPLHKPVVPRTNEVLEEYKEEDEIKAIKNDIDKKVKQIDETHKEEILQDLYNDEIYKFDKQPRTFKDYVKLARNNPGAVIAIMNPWTGEPQFVLKNNGKRTKVYENNDAISRFYRFYPKDIQTIVTKAQSPSSQMLGQFKHDKVDQIRLQEHPVRFNKDNLPDDVLLIQHSKGNDDDPDAGGERVRDEEDFMRRHHEALNEIDSDKEEDKGYEEYTPLLEKKRNDDDSDEEMMFGTPKGRKSSDDYKLEIARLTNDKEQLIKHLEKNTTVADLEFINQQLREKLENFGREIEYLKQVEDSAEKDYRNMKIEFNKQVEEIYDMKLTNKELKKKLEENQKYYDEEIRRYAEVYESSRTEAAQEIEYIKKNYEKELKQLKYEYLNLKQTQKEKDIEIKNLYQSMDDGNRIANQIQDELNTYKKKYHDLEAQRNKDLQNLNQKMRQQEGSFEATRQSEISQLSQTLERLEAEKNQYQSKISELEKELTNTKNFANTKYDEVVNEKRELEQEIRNKEFKLQEQNDVYKNYVEELAQGHKNKKSEYENKINEQAEMIRQLSSQLEQMNKGSIREETKIEEEIPIQEIPQISQTREGMQTRSHGPANTGQEIVQELFDPNGNLIWKGMTFELAGKQYDTPEFVLNLIKYNTSNQIKIFKNAYEQRQQTLGDKSTYNNQKYVNKAIEILIQQLNNNKQNIALVMKAIIDKEKVLKEFSNVFNKDYAQYLKK